MNQVRKTIAGQNTTYGWDLENRLTSVTFSNATTVQYEYSTDGNRLSRTHGGAKMWYAFDFRDRNGFDDVITEYNATGGLVARYVHGPGIDEPFGMSRGSTYFYSFDALGSVTRLTSTSQATSARYRYEAFGAGRDTSEGAVNAYRFTSRELDSAVSLHFYRARWYDAQAGRFMGKDPLGTASGPNPYLYAGGNPVTMTDPSGKSLCTDAVNFACSAIFGILAWALCWWAIGLWFWPWVYIACLIMTTFLVGALCSIASYLLCGERINWCGVWASAVCGATIGGSSFRLKGGANPLVALFSAAFCVPFSNAIQRNCR